MQLVKYSKGGLGDVRQLDELEFDLYYDCMIELNRLEEKEIKRREDAAKKKG